MAQRARTARAARTARHRRVRTKVRGTTQRPRLCVFRSLGHIYAQVIDDSKGHTLASASSIEADVRAKHAGSAKKAVAETVGGLVAQRAIAQGAKKVVFDRGGYKFHGRVQVLADAARQGGLVF